MEKRDIPLSERNSSAVGRRGASTDDLPEAPLDWEQWLDCITDILFVADSEGRIVRANRAMAEAFGTTAEELVGRNCTEVLFGDDPTPEGLACCAVLKSGGCVRRELLLPGHEGVYLSSDYGLERSDGSVGGAVVWIKDITERKHAKDLTVVQRDLAVALSAAVDLDEALKLCVETAIRTTGMDSGGIYLVDETHGFIDLAYHKGLTPDFIRRSSRFDAHAPRARLVQEGKPIYTRCAQLRVSTKDVDYKEGLSVIAVIPILYDGRVIACLNIASHSLKYISIDVRNTLETIAAQIGSVIARLRAEKALLEQTRRNALVLKTSMDGFMVIGTDGKIREVNRAFADIACCSREELVNMPLEHLDIPETGEELAGHIAAIIENGYDRFASRLRRKDGRVVELEIGAQFADIGGDQFIFSFIRDVTERKNTESELRARTELLDAVLSDITESVTIENGDYEIEHMNRTGIEQYGDGVGRKCYEHYMGRAEPCEMLCPIRELLVKNAPSPIHFSRVMDDGSEIEVVSSIITRPDGGRAVLSAGRDVTGRKNTESELRARTELLDAVLSDITESVTIENGDYEIEHMNRTGIEQYGDGVGRKCYEHYMGRAEPCEMLCPIRELLVKNAPSPIHFSRVMDDGSEIEVVSSIITRPDGGRVVLATGRDVTERKRLEEQLRQAQKMETVGTLAGGVAHEFNNLHCGILGYLDIILRRETLSDSVREKLERVHLATMRAADVTRNLLVFSRKQPSRKRPACLDEVVRETLKIVQAEFETSGIRVRAKLKAAAEFLMDRGQIGQVLMNLLVNARDSMMDSDRKELSITTSLDRRRATLKVSDTGCGIPKSALTRIFEPFYTTKGPLGGLGGKTAEGIPGTGLGLSVCHGIVKDHGGTISAKSEQGVGTTFTVTVPRIQVPAVAERKASHVRAARGERVVLVDDDKMVRDMILELLKTEGYHGVGFGDGEKAFADIKRNKTDAVILDLQMPGVSGVEFLRRINEIPKNDRPTVIVVTGKETNSDVEGYSELHVFDTIRKPFIPSDLLERLYAALHER